MGRAASRSRLYSGASAKSRKSSDVTKVLVIPLGQDNSWKYVSRSGTTPLWKCGEPRNYKYEQERKLGKFFWYVCNGKKIKELLPLRGITASVKCASSIIVVLNAKLTQSIAAHARKKYSEKQKVWRECRFLLVETHKRLTSITIFTVHAKTSLLYIFQRSMQSNKNINLC